MRTAADTIERMLDIALDGWQRAMINGIFDGAWLAGAASARLPGVDQSPPRVCTCTINVITGEVLDREAACPSHGVNAGAPVDTGAQRRPGADLRDTARAMVSMHEVTRRSLRTSAVLGGWVEARQYGLRPAAADAIVDGALQSFWEVLQRWAAEDEDDDDDDPVPPGQSVP